MKPNKLLSRCLLLSACTISASALSQTLNVNLSGFRSDQGQLVVNIYTSKKTWLSDKPAEIFQQSIFPLAGALNDNSLQFSLELPEGEYALYAFQDKDNNGELKSNWIGIPKEPVATSNNAKGSMGPPKYQDAKFSVAADNNQQSIELANLD